MRFSPSWISPQEVFALQVLVQFHFDLLDVGEVLQANDFHGRPAESSRGFKAPVPCNQFIVARNGMMGFICPCWRMLAMSSVEIPKSFRTRFVITMSSIGIRISFLQQETTAAPHPGWKTCGSGSANCDRVTEGA